MNLSESATLPSFRMSTMSINNLFRFFCFLFVLQLTASYDDFTFNGFSTANMSLAGDAFISSNGLLELTPTSENVSGHAFHPTPLHFKLSDSKPLSFSTTFVFAIRSDIPDVGGHGLAFLISPTTNLSTALPGQFLGLFNQTNNGSSTDHIIAVELDIIQNPEFQDINDNHVGIDFDSLNSYKSLPSSYFDNTTGLFKNLTLKSGQSMQVWIDFDGGELQLNVTLSPVGVPKPDRPLLSVIFNLASLMVDPMYVGFSASSFPFHTNHYILGWSFQMNGTAEALNYAKLPVIPSTNSKGSSDKMAIWLPISLCLFVLLVIAATLHIMRRRMKYAELLEDWELEYGPHRFSYKDLYQATRGFNEEELLGTGGFGRVYRGVLSTSNMEVAVKKVSHKSNSQGLREFVAEIVSMGQLRHRNVVQLLGYCRRKGELLLVYEFMTNGSLDKFLYDRTKPPLNWTQRFQIIKGVASGLLYLHEDWEQVVVHRDIKASNVCLDHEFNGKLGDFGLARLYDRGTDPQTTHIVGTRGYLAPELALVGKATTSTDVFAFGAFLLEVICGRRPVEPNSESEKLVLVDFVLHSWRRGSLIETIDPRLGKEYCAYEVDLVLRLGLLCSHPMPSARPSMRKVMRILDGDAEHSKLLSRFPSFSSLSLHQNIAFDDYIQSFGSSAFSTSTISGRS